MRSDASPYIGHRIRPILERMERPESWLARKMGISQPHLNRVLAGQRTITNGFVERACAVLSLSADAIFIRESADMAQTTEPAGELVGVA